MQGDTSPSRDKKIDENLPGPSQRRSERLSHLENLQLTHLLHVVILKDKNSFIHMSRMNVLVTHFAIISERRFDKSK